MRGIEIVKVVKFKGGLGNQLFQYVFLRRLEILFYQAVKADFSFYKNAGNDIIKNPKILNFNVRINKITEKELKNILHYVIDDNPKKLSYKAKIFIEKSINRRYFFEKNRLFIDISSIINYDYFDGYWQSYKYLKGIEDIVKTELVLKEPISKSAQKWIELLSKENSIFIGSRFSDYLLKKTKKKMGIMDLYYYVKAMEIIKNSVNNPLFIVFSDDIKLAKDYFKGVKNLIFFEEPKISDEEELIIRSKCKHAIIPNSTYNWWGAWLIENPSKIIIAPKKWFADGSPIEIIPPEWISI